MRYRCDECKRIFDRQRTFIASLLCSWGCFFRAVKKGKGKWRNIVQPKKVGLKQFRLPAMGAGRSVYSAELNGWFRSVWEINFGRWLVKNNLEWIYEPCTFDLGKLKYLPDFYILDWSAWVEIKGREQDKDIKKIEAFKNQLKNILQVLTT